MKTLDWARQPRRRVGAAAVAAAIAVAAVAGPASIAGATGSGGGTVTIGIMTTVSGPNGLYGKPVANTARFAAKRLNAAGGIDGRKVKIVVADDAGTPAGSLNAVKQLLLQDHVNALVMETNSADRDAVMPLVSRTGTPSFYASLYEGHACYKNLFVVGEVPPQYAPVYKYAVSSLHLC